MLNENYNLDIEITAKFRVNDAIDKETLDLEFDGDLIRYVKNCLLDDETLFGIVEDEYEVIGVEEA